MDLWTLDKLGVPTVALTIVILIVVLLPCHLYAVIDKNLARRLAALEN